MRKLLIRFLVFASLFFALLKGIGAFDAIDRTTNPNLNVVKLQQLPHYDSLDILFIGNSYCYNGIDPAHFDSLGLRSFNLGIATAGPDFYELIVADYLAVNQQAPRLALVLVSPVTFSVKADNWESYPIHRYLNEPLSNEALVLQQAAAAETYVPLLVSSCSRGAQNLLKALAGPTPAVPSALRQTKGYEPAYAVTSKAIEDATEHLYLPFSSETFDEDKVTQLLQLAASLQQAGSRVVFFELPTNRLQSYFNEAYLAGYAQALSTFDSSYGLVQVALPLAAEHYKNLDHLNVYGATLVSQALIRELQARQLLPLNPGSPATP